MTSINFLYRRELLRKFPARVNFIENGNKRKHVKIST